MNKSTVFVNSQLHELNVPAALPRELRSTYTLAPRSPTRYDFKQRSPEPNPETLKLLPCQNEQPGPMQNFGDYYSGFA